MDYDKTSFNYREKLFSLDLPRDSFIGKRRLAILELKYTKKIYVLCICLYIYFSPVVYGEAPIMIGLGDSIGEGVQSVDANLRTQPFSYLSLLAEQLGVDFPLPLIRSSPIGIVGDSRLRVRLNPSVESLNLSVVGADVDSLLNERADASCENDIDTEIDLVLFPRMGSQVEIAESLGASLMICWVGNNDVLSAVTSFDELDGTGLTPTDEFEANFSEIAERLVAAGQNVVFANVGDVTSIGFLLDRQDLLRFLGSDFGLPEGEFTSAAAMLLIRLGLDGDSILNNPNFILDADEVQLIQERIEAFNNIISEAADNVGMPVVDVNNLLKELSTNPPDFSGIPISTRYLGGVFSLDGVHPSNIGHAIVANTFIKTINTHFNSNIPLISDDELGNIFNSDPHVDKDADGRVKGRPGAGLLETLGPTLAISGDYNDSIQTFLPLVDASLCEQFIRNYLSLKGEGPEISSRWDKDDIIAAFKHIFGLDLKQ